MNGALQCLCMPVRCHQRQSCSTSILSQEVNASAFAPAFHIGFLRYAQWSILVGLVLGVASYYSVILMKHKLRIDDALDVSSVHGEAFPCTETTTAVYCLDLCFSYAAHVVMIRKTVFELVIPFWHNGCQCPLIALGWPQA